MLLVKELKVFDESLFSFFFTHTRPDKALDNFDQPKQIKLPTVAKQSNVYPVVKPSTSLTTKASSNKMRETQNKS